MDTDRPFLCLTGHARLKRPRPMHRLGSSLDIQLRINMVDVRFNCGQGHKQFGGDLVVGVLLADELQDLPFFAGEPGGWGGLGSGFGVVIDRRGAEQALHDVAQEVEGEAVVDQLWCGE